MLLNALEQAAGPLLGDWGAGVRPVSARHRSPEVHQLQQANSLIRIRIKTATHNASGARVYSAAPLCSQSIRIKSLQAFRTKLAGLISM